MVLKKDDPRIRVTSGGDGKVVFEASKEGQTLTMEATAEEAIHFATAILAVSQKKVFGSLPWHLLAGKDL